MRLTYEEVTAPQRSPGWYAARCGRLTGSVASDMVDTIKSGESAKRRDLRFRLALEQITGTPEEGPDLSRIPHVQRGVELEDFARMALEETTGLLFIQSGFLRAEELMVGCSLDAHTGEIGAIEEIAEIKCPKSTTQIGYLDGARLPPAYEAQVMHNLWITGAKACHFFSYDDRLPGKLARFHHLVRAADLPIKAYVEKAARFLDEVEALRIALSKRSA